MKTKLIKIKLFFLIITSLAFGFNFNIAMGHEGKPTPTWITVEKGMFTGAELIYRLACDFYQIIDPAWLYSPASSGINIFDIPSTTKKDKRKKPITLLTGSEATDENVSETSTNIHFNTPADSPPYIQAIAEQLENGYNNVDVQDRLNLIKAQSASLKDYRKKSTSSTSSSSSSASSSTVSAGSAASSSLSRAIAANALISDNPLISAVILSNSNVAASSVSTSSSSSSRNSHWIKRDIEEILEKDISKIIIIVGPRQAGKTSLARKIFEKKGFKFIRLDSPEIKNLAEKNPEQLLRNYDSNLIIDEIQEVPELLEQIINGIKQGSDKRFVLTGSQGFLLSELLNQIGSNNISKYTLLPLSINELKKQNILPTLNVLEVKGFYPGNYRENQISSQISQPSLQIIDNFGYGNYINSLGKDMSLSLKFLQEKLKPDSRDLKHLNVPSREVYQQSLTYLKDILSNKFILLLQFLTQKIGTQNIGEIIRELENEIASDDRIQRSYVQYDLCIIENELLKMLEKSFMIFRLKNLNNQLKQSDQSKNSNNNNSNNDYIYFYDIGLASNLIGHESDVGIKGHLFESMVIAEIFKLFYKMHLSPEEHVFYWHDNNHHEIDCVIKYKKNPSDPNEPEKWYPIEFKRHDSISNPASIISKKKDDFRNANYWKKFVESYKKAHKDQNIEVRDLIVIHNAESQFEKERVQLNWNMVDDTFFETLEKYSKPVVTTSSSSSSNESPVASSPETPRSTSPVSSSEDSPKKQLASPIFSPERSKSTPPVSSSSSNGSSTSSPEASGSPLTVSSPEDSPKQQLKSSIFSPVLSKSTSPDSSSSSSSSPEGTPTQSRSSSSINQTSITQEMDGCENEESILNKFKESLLIFNDDKEFLKTSLEKLKTKFENLRDRMTKLHQKLKDLKNNNEIWINYNKKYQKFINRIRIELKKIISWIFNQNIPNPNEQTKDKK